MRNFVLPLSLFASAASAAYNIVDDYTPSAFASMFDFYTGDDPTNGYVNYVDQATAQSSGLFKTQNNQIYLGVDNTNTATGRGRNSLRISSKKSYNKGLFVLDMNNMPGGQCGTWPAFWLLGSTEQWPNGGEIDIIEGVNSQNYNSMAMHTDAGCSITNTGLMSGTLETSNCDVNAPGQAQNAGCSIHNSNAQSYGTGFNANGGGIYVTEWTDEAISIWFFPRNAIPSDVQSGNPNPANWGLPMGRFAGACDLDEHVLPQQMIFDITFCGSWAGQVWSQDATCSQKASTCQAFVQNNPSAFQDTYWLINSLKVYQNNGNAQPTTTTSQQPSTTTTAIATTLTTQTTPTTSATAVAPTTPAVTTPGLPTTATTSTTSTTTTTSTSLTTLPVPPTTTPLTTSVPTTPITTPATTVAPQATSTGSWGGWNGWHWGDHNGGGDGGWPHGGWGRWRMRY